MLHFQVSTLTAQLICANRFRTLFLWHLAKIFSRISLPHCGCPTVLFFSGLALGSSSRDKRNSFAKILEELYPVIMPAAMVFQTFEDFFKK